MTLSNKISSIRRKKGLSQTELAQAVNFSQSYINRVEQGNRTISEEFLNAFRQVVDLPNVPLTDNEVELFKARLRSWKDIINYGDYDKARELKPGLAQSAKWSQEPELQIYFDLYDASFYHATRDMDKRNEIIASLSTNPHTFNGEQQYLRLRLVGIRELSVWKYRTALTSFLEAEKLGESLGLNDEGLYYNIAYCFTDMGYAYLANEFFEKSLQMLHSKANYSYDNQIRSFIAWNISQLGKTDEALAILEGCIREEKSKATSISNIGAFYKSIARIHHRIGNFAEAIENVDEAASHFEPTSKSYGYNLYYKAIILIENNKMNEGMDCLNESLGFFDDASLEHLKLSMLRHSTSLNKPSSLKFIESTAIPKLLDHGAYQELIMHCDKIRVHYEAKNMYKKAYEYSHLSQKLTTIIHKGVITYEKDL